jgi:hypothetical protein
MTCTTSKQIALSIIVGANEPIVEYIDRDEAYARMNQVGRGLPPSPLSLPAHRAPKGKRPGTAAMTREDTMEQAIKAMRDARLMLYAWKGVRQKQKWGDHPVLDRTIRELEEAIAAIDNDQRGYHAIGAWSRNWSISAVEQ